MNFVRVLSLLSVLSWVAAPSLVSVGIAAEDPKEFKVSHFTFERPAKWEWVKVRSTMRAAQLRAPGKAKEAVDVVFYYFGPGNGGGTQANINRWFKQFKEPKEDIKAKVESKTVGAAKKKVTYVEAEGTFMSGPPFGQKIPKPGFLLLGAIVEDAKGNVFVKMTGPAKEARQAIGALKQMVEGSLKGK